MTDGEGLYGFILHYALLFAFFGSAFIVFLYLWKKKRLDMDEEPKYFLFNDED
ncbi:MAG: hypothetical protein JJU12_04135 [Chlamydiales bacterium]|nr:hypothetical protein [Chlamydiales bacterium]